MPYIKPTNRKFCLNSDIADVLLMKQEQYPCEPYDEPYYNPIDKKFQMKEEILKNFWLGCENVKGCADKMRSPSAPYEVWLGIDKYYLENIFKYPVTPNDLPYNEPQFAYTKTQWVQYKDIFGVNYHFTINNKLSDSWETHYYKQTNKKALPTPNTLNKNFVVTSFKERKRGTYTDNYDTAKANQPDGCEHYDRYTDESRLIAHHGIPPLKLMYKVGTTWVQDSFTSSETPFIATATPANYIIPSSANSTTYDTDITFSLPEYSGLTEVNYVWNIRQIESGLTLKANIKQKKKTGTVRFSDGNTIYLKGIGSEGSKGVIPKKGIVYTGDYNDGVNDTISWMNKTNGYSPATGNFTDETHADSTGLDDNIRITSNQSWCHDIVYNLTGWSGYVDWWKDGEEQGSRTATITMTKYDPRLDVVTPYKFNIEQAAPVVKWCYYFSGLDADNLDCHGGSVSATVATSIKKKYHDYSICDDGVSDYHVKTYNLGWSIAPSTIGENTTCGNLTHKIVATQDESGLQLETYITQSYDCETENYIRNCSVSPSNVGSDGGTVTFSADALYYIRHCTDVVENDSSFTIGDGPAPSCNISVNPSSESVVCDTQTTKTVTVSSTGSWSGSGNGCTVSPSTGSAGNTNVTVTIPASTSSASATFKCDGNSTTYNISRSGSGCSGGGGGGDCSCCRSQVYTPTAIHSLDHAKKTINIYVTYSCSACTGLDWEIFPVDGSWPSWVHWSKTSGGGNCNDVYDCNKHNSAEVVAAGKAETVTVTLDENTTGTERRCNWGYRPKNSNCFEYAGEYFKQSAKPAETGCTDCYVAFQNSRTENMTAAGGTLNNEGIVKHGTGSNCKVDVKDFTVTVNGVSSSIVSINPSNGDINSCNITVPENTSTQDRTIVITIHPNIDEKNTTNCKSTKSLNVLAKGQSYVVYNENGEVYSDYTDDNDMILLASTNTITIPENTDYVSKTHNFTLTNAGGKKCSVSVTQDAATPPPP